METVTIGALRRRMTLQVRTLNPDGGGGFAESWSDLAAFWADMEPTASVETIIGEQQQHRVTHQVTIRYRAGIQPGQRLIHDGRALYILGIVNPGERNAFLKLQCEERTTP